LFITRRVFAAAAAAGVNLTIRGSQLPTFPPNISATALQTAISKALNRSALGVEIIQNPAAGTLTYRLLTNRTAFPDDLSPADISLQLVVMPNVCGSTTGSSSTSGSTSGSTGSAVLISSSTTSYTCLKLGTEARVVNFTNADGSSSSMTVYEEVWQNITITDNSSSIIAANASANSDAGDSAAAAAAADVMDGLSVEVSQQLEPPPPGGSPRGAWQLQLEGQDQVGLRLQSGRFLCTFHADMFGFRV
jgi:hypothetical protein